MFTLRQRLNERKLKKKLKIVPVNVKLIKLILKHVSYTSLLVSAYIKMLILLVSTQQGKSRPRSLCRAVKCKRL
jgi:hypothetical protein